MTNDVGLGGDKGHLTLIYYKRKSDGMSRAPAFLRVCSLPVGMLSDFCYSGNLSSYMIVSSP